MNKRKRILLHTFTIDEVKELLNNITYERKPYITYENKKISASFDIMKIGTPNKGFNHKTMEAFRAGKLMDGKRRVSNISEAMKMASG